jgi:hypothetical protein
LLRHDELALGGDAHALPQRLLQLLDSL